MRSGPRRAVAARGRVGPRTANDRAPIRAWASRCCSWHGSALLFVPELWVARVSHLRGARADGAAVGRAGRADHVAPASHRGAIRSADADRAGRVDPRRPPSPIQAALASGEALSALVPLIVGGLLIVYSMWWVYFDRPVHDLLTSLRKAIVWGYGHYFVFAAAAAVGAGLAVSVDQVDASCEGRHGWRRRRRCHSRRDLPAVPLASARPAGISPDATARPDWRGPRPADAVYGPRRSADGSDSDGAGRDKAGDAATGSMIVPQCHIAQIMML